MRALLNRQKELLLVQNKPGLKAKAGEVTVRVHSASLNPTDLDIINGDYDFFLWLYGAKSQVRTGLEFSGTVVEDSERFRKGDRVFGYPHLFKGPKTHSEVVNVKENHIAHMPDSLSFEQAAGIPIGVLTSYIAWHDLAKVQRGDHVLINGGSGGVGVYAIQLAKLIGAHVTAIAGPSGQDFMKDLGADTVYNYQVTRVGDLAQQFDVILDLACKLKFKAIRHILKPDGMFIPADPMQNIADILLNPVRRQKVAYLMVEEGNHKLLSELGQKFETGALKVPNSLKFAIYDFAKAIQELKVAGSSGRIVLNFL